MPQLRPWDENSCLFLPQLTAFVTWKKEQFSGEYHVICQENKPSNLKGLSRNALGFLNVTCKE